MKKAILATKVGMTQIFNEDGTLIPVSYTHLDVYKRQALSREMNWERGRQLTGKS